MATFIPSILTGALLVHLLWPAREPKALVLKAFLGMGMGLGISSLAYFAFLSLFAGQHWFMGTQVALLLVVLAAVIWQWGRRPAVSLISTTPFRASRVQSVLFGIAGLIFLISLFSTASYLLRRKQGDWDAWMMYNRAARFVHRDQTGWLGSFTPQMDPIFHADYPLFLAMNIASGWDIAGGETSSVPMAQSGLFALACAGLLVSALAFGKTPGTAALGLIIWWGTPAVVIEGARELADLPLAYFFLSTLILVWLYARLRRPGLLILAGLSAGMAAWMKNEGSVFVLAATVAVLVVFWREKPWRMLAWYALGLVVPLAFVLYFKSFLAPPSDVLSSPSARAIAQALDPTRHLQILRALGTELLGFGGWRLLAWPIGIIVVLLVYLAVSRERSLHEDRPLMIASVVLLVVQMLGYYGIYVITPYDLQWHLEFSVWRIFLQIFPLVAFAVLVATRPPESVFDRD